MASFQLSSTSEANYSKTVQCTHRGCQSLLRGEGSLLRGLTYQGALLVVLVLSPQSIDPLLTRPLCRCPSPSPPAALLHEGCVRLTSSRRACDSTSSGRRGRSTLSTSWASLPAASLGAQQRAHSRPPSSALHFTSSSHQSLHICDT